MMQVAEKKTKFRSADGIALLGTLRSVPSPRLGALFVARHNGGQGRGRLLHPVRREHGGGRHCLAQVRFPGPRQERRQLRGSHPVGRDERHRLGVQGALGEPATRHSKSRRRGQFRRRPLGVLGPGQQTPAGRAGSAQPAPRPTARGCSSTSRSGRTAPSPKRAGRICAETDGCRTANSGSAGACSTSCSAYGRTRG